MTIRTYRRGDETAQISIYNESAAALPGFKPANLDEQGRRLRARDFDPTTRIYAIDNGHPVAYVSFQANGRVGYPWCRQGFEYHAESLLEAVLAALRSRGLQKVFAAYREDWIPQAEFFLAHGFAMARHVVNYVLDPAEMPTPSVKRTYPMLPVEEKDIPEILALVPGAFRVDTADELAKHLLHNPYFPADSAFLLRSRAGGELLGAAVIVLSPTYASPDKVDSKMPCYRLGAFGSEGMTTKRINGLFSFVAAPSQELTPIALDLLGHAAQRLDHFDGKLLAGQVGSDMVHLHRFHEQYMRKQGGFPVFERAI